MTCAPMSTVGEITCTQSALLTTSQAQCLAVLSCRLPLPPAALYLAAAGINWKTQSVWALLACTIVKVWPPTLMLPWRGVVVVLSRTRKPIVAAPLPFGAVAMAIQLSEGVAFQAHPVAHNRSNRDSLPTALISRALGESVKTQLPGFCVTVKVAVPTVTVPVRCAPPALASTV